jgi:hypothetical protein
MSPVNYLEPRFGRYAISHLVQILAVFQVGVWVLCQFLTDGRDAEFLTKLVLFPHKVLEGEVWRLLTFMFIPKISGVLWVAFFLIFALIMGEVFEKAWGSFRLNLYIVGGWLAVAAGMMIFSLSPSPNQAVWIGSSIFLAFAVILPDYTIMAFLVVPVKAWHLAAIDAVLMVLHFIDNPGDRLLMLLHFSNFIVFYTPRFYRFLTGRAKVAARRAKFDSAKVPEGSWIHKCHACGKTELDDPKLEFRVGSDGEDYCSACRPKKKAGSDS